MSWISFTKQVGMYQWNQRNDFWMKGRTSFRRLFQTISKSELKSLITKEKALPLQNRESVIIDVREPTEIEATGSIETAINVPVSKVQETLQMENPQFSKVFGISKESFKKKQLIFSCKVGGRAAMACNIAEANGFSNVKNFQGSFLEWSGMNPREYDSKLQLFQSKK